MRRTRTVESVRRIIYFAHACTLVRFAKHSDDRLDSVRLPDELRARFSGESACDVVPRHSTPPNDSVYANGSRTGANVRSKAELVSDGNRFVILSRRTQLDRFSFPRRNIAEIADFYYARAPFESFNTVSLARTFYELSTSSVFRPLGNVFVLFCFPPVIYWDVNRCNRLFRRSRKNEKQ